MKAFEKNVAGGKAFTSEERAAMEQEFRSLMIRFGKGELLKSMLLQEQLLDYLEANPLNVEDETDLNPHLHLDYICDRIVERMSNVEHLSVSKEQVLLFWLTNQIYNPYCFKGAYERTDPL